MWIWQSDEKFFAMPKCRVDRRRRPRAWLLRDCLSYLIRHCKVDGAISCRIVNRPREAIGSFVGMG